MSSRNPTDWMWAQAIELLEQAERMHRQFFRLASSERTQAVWEPPVDMFEAGLLVIRAESPLPFSGSRRAVRQLEIPYGYFERRIPLPEGRLETGTRELLDGCLILRLRKIG